MLIFENPYGAGIPVKRDTVIDAVRTLCHAQLISVAQETRLFLGQDSFDAFANHIENTISNPAISLTPLQLVIEAQLFAMRGAQSVLAEELHENQLRFHEWTWANICPVWPFC